MHPAEAKLGWCLPQCLPAPYLVFFYFQDLQTEQARSFLFFSQPEQQLTGTAGTQSTRTQGQALEEDLIYVIVTVTYSSHLVLFVI